MELPIEGTDKVTVVDEGAGMALRRHRWRITKTGYVYRWAGVIVLIHREIMWQELSTRKGYQVDHIDGDKLNNRRSNLRVVKAGVNILNNHRPRSDNKSGIVGVYWDAVCKRWKAVCGRDYLGSFKTREEAGAVRKKEVERRGGRHSVVGRSSVMESEKNRRPEGVKIELELPEETQEERRVADWLARKKRRKGVEVALEL